ncbi:MAG: polysaccharide biosynthesis C-terminal domain-containing protein [Clostridia bacterium]|nr:polysaccharide biosynthesis C-terminal domain-containing protein [Clostridia bacterium]
MNKYKTLLSNTFLISMGTFASKLLVFFMVRFYTDYLTTSQYGTADLITQTANLLFPVISLGITEGVFRFGLSKENNPKSVFSTGLWIISAGALLFAAIIPALCLVNDFKGYVWLIVVYTLAACLHSLCAQYIRAIGKTALFAIQGIINTSLVIILNIIFLTGVLGVNLGVTGYVLSVAVADTLCALFLIIKEKLWRLITLKIEKTILKDMLKYSIPLIPTTIFWWITSVSDRYMVNEFISPEANGIYAVSYKLPTLLTLVSTVFMQAWQFSAVTEDDGDKEEHAKFFSKVWGSFQAVMFLAGGFVIAFAKIAMKLLTTYEFYSSWEYVPLLSVAMIFTAFTSFMGTVYVVNKKSVISFLTALVGAVTNIILNLILIPSPLGVQGAAIATVASYVLVFIIRSINARKYIKFKLHIGHIILNSIIIFIQTLVMIFEVNYFIIIESLALISLLIINLKFIKGFLTKILSFAKK